MANPLNKLSPKKFLSEFWQKKPLLIRDAYKEFPWRIAPEELAGLSCETGVDSRLIQEKGGKKPWEVRRGPFKAKVFSALPKTHWTLLVNGVDRLLPQVADLVDDFSFLPSWRVDDVMISYAVKGGNVGAHVDNFDVFLIQASGRREWQISEKPVWEDDFIPDLDVRLLRKFRPTKKWVLEPGDMLYLPPRVPHHGISLTNDCMTYSVGFRAPSVSELVSAAVNESLGSLDERKRFQDPGRRMQRSGEISSADLRQLEKTVRDALISGEEFRRWAGVYLSEGRSEETLYEPSAPISPKELAKILQKECSVRRVEGVRAFYISLNDKIGLYVNGQEYLLNKNLSKFAQLLTSRQQLPAGAFGPYVKEKSAMQLLAELVNCGFLYLPELGDEYFSEA